MTALTCKYHPDREANSKCEKCGAMVCLECKNIFRRSYSSGTDSSSYTSTYELCPECYAIAVKQSYNPLCFVAPAIMVLFIIGGVTMVFWDTGFSAIFLMIPIPILGILGYQFFIKGPREKAEAERKKAAALGNLSHFSNLNSSYSSNLQNTHFNGNTNFSDSKPMYCEQCGKRLDSDSKFCKYCGNSV